MGIAELPNSTGAQSIGIPGSGVSDSVNYRVVKFLSKSEMPEPDHWRAPSPSGVVVYLPKDSGTSEYGSSDQQVIHQAGSIKLWDALDFIVDTFGLNISELANVVRVQRKTIYDWKSGQFPQEAKLNRVFALLDVAESWSRLGYPTDKVSLLSNVLDGHSVIELLASPNLSTEEIMFAGDRLALRAAAGSEHNLL